MRAPPGPARLQGGGARGLGSSGLARRWAGCHGAARGRWMSQNRDGLRVASAGPKTASELSQEGAGPLAESWGDFLVVEL